MIDFNLPELGENVTAGDVLRVLVKPGDALTKDQPVLELETDKATIEVPSSVAGKVKDIKVKAGDKVKVGQAILSVDENGAASEKPAANAGGPRAAAAPASPSVTAAAGADTPAEVPDARPGLQPHIQGQKRQSDKSGPVDERGAQGPTKVVDISRGARPAPEPNPAPELPVAPAAPSVRRMARELGVEINQVAGSGPAGRISIEDVKEHAKRIVTGEGGGRVAAGAPVPVEPLP